jgi:hypothetical protein
MGRRDITDDPRHDAQLSEQVEHALHIVQTDGIGPALDFMQSAGVPRPTALRVLCSPAHFRQGERRR